MNEENIGRADIIIKTDDPDAGIVIELKRAEEISELDDKCNMALTQIQN